MNSRERVLAAIRRQPTDYLPFVPHFWSSPIVEEYAWRDERERLEVIVRRLGADAVLHFGVGVSRHSEVRTRVWEERAAGETWPLLHKVVHTPRGDLSAVVRKTDDWPHGDDIPFFSDFAVSRYVKPWIETMEDADAFATVYQAPGDAEIASARERWSRSRALADEFGVPLWASFATGLTGALQNFGAQPAVVLSMDQPAVLERYLEIVATTESRCLEILLDLGVDVVRRNGWYESTDFWSPAQFERLVAPVLSRDTLLAHEAGVPFNYTMCTGIMPLLPMLARMEFDSLDTIEPVLGGQDMPLLAKVLGERKCLWGGVSAPIHVGEGRPADVRAAVRRAVVVFGRQGFILTAVPSIRPRWPWENVAALFDEWRRVR